MASYCFSMKNDHIVMVEFGKAPSWICCFSHCFVCVSFLWRIRRRRRGRKKFRPDFLLLREENEPFLKWKWNYSPWHFCPNFHSCCSYIRQLHFTWIGYPRKSRTGSVFISTTQRDYNWSLTEKIISEELSTHLLYINNYLGKIN